MRHAFTLALVLHCSIAIGVLAMPHYTPDQWPDDEGQDIISGIVMALFIIGFVILCLTIAYYVLGGIL